MINLEKYSSFQVWCTVSLYTILRKRQLSYVHLLFFHLCAGELRACIVQGGLIPILQAFLLVVVTRIRISISMTKRSSASGLAPLSPLFCCYYLLVYILFILENNLLQASTSSMQRLISIFQTILLLLFRKIGPNHCPTSYQMITDTSRVLWLQ